MMYLVAINNELSVMDMPGYIQRTWNPATDCKVIFPLSIKGDTYKQKKNNLIDIALDYQEATCEYSGLSYGEYAILGDFFSVNAKRYGLVNEFKENAII